MGSECRHRQDIGEITVGGHNDELYSKCCGIGTSTQGWLAIAFSFGIIQVC